jgi:long-chain acyl-CoA synthetase
MTWHSIPALFYTQAERRQSDPLVYGKSQGHWRPLTWTQVARRAKAAAAGLMALGLNPKDRVGIWAKNSPEWVIADLSSQSAALINVPIHEQCATRELKHMLVDSGVRLLFVEGLNEINHLIHLEEKNQIEWIISFDELPIEIHDQLPNAKTYSLIALEQLGIDAHLEKEVEARYLSLQRDDLMTLQYTSGTTGNPKAVMLTQGNLLSNCEGCMTAIPVHSTDVILSFLPLSHSFERLAGYYMPILFGGARLYFAESMGKLIRNMNEVQPTILTGVPRLFEKIYARFRGRRGIQGTTQNLLLNWSLHLAQNMAKSVEKNQAPSWLVKTQYEFAQTKLFKELRDRLGGRIRFMISGGAALSVEVANFFYAAGLLILEGYGLSETSPVLTVNRPNLYRFGSVGKPLDNVVVKLAKDGEICVKGENVSQGYWQLPEETKALFDEDHYLKTGDIGSFDTHGFLYITDRKKDLFKTATGKYVSPQYLERLLCSEPLIEQACVIGDQKPYCVALIVLSTSEIEALFDHFQEGASDLKQYVKDAGVKLEVQRLIQKINLQLGGHEAIRKFYLCEQRFDEQDLLTASLKIKRNATIQKYQAEIEQLYFGEKSI